jgi:hypothetical protein
MKYFSLQSVFSPVAPLRAFLLLIANRLSPGLRQLHEAISITRRLGLDSALSRGFTPASQAVRQILLSGSDEDNA